MLTPFSSCKISKAFHHLVRGGELLTWTGGKSIGLYIGGLLSLKIPHPLNLHLRTPLGLLPLLPQRSAGDAHSWSLLKAPIQPTIRNTCCLGKNCSRGPVSLGCTRKVAAGPTWAYFSLGHPKGDSQTGSPNTSKPPLNHFPRALPAVPAGSKRCDNHPYPSQPPQTIPVPATPTGTPHVH